MLSAAHAVQGIEPDAIKARLEAQLVEILFDELAASCAEGEAALDMTVRLVSRLYPAIRLTPIGAGATAKTEGLLDLARSINPAIDHGAKRAATARLVLGETAPSASAVPTVFAGSDAWLARVSSKSPVGFGASRLPFGAGAAACLASANLFRAIFRDLLPKCELDGVATLSLLDFSTGAGASQGPLAISADVGVAPLVGVGAIGNAVVWALARAPGLLGTLHLVDHERIELSNLQRYVLTRQQDEGRQKVALATEAFASSGLAAEPFPVSWAEYAGARDFEPVERAIVALDSARDRIGVQSSLPRSTINAWTQVGDLGVSRHKFLGDKACLACLYLPSGTQPNEDQLIARALRLPEEPQSLLHPLRDLLVSGGPVGEDFVRDVASRLEIEAGLLMPFAGEPLRSFCVKAVCGGITLQPTAHRPIEAPLAFQSALAGIMLAAELVAEAGALRRGPLPTKTIIDIMRPLGSRLNVNVAKPGASAPARCICEDDIFVDAYRKKYERRPKKRTRRVSRGRTRSEVKSPPGGRGSPTRSNSRSTT